jgi:hypothetical protein
MALKAEGFAVVQDGMLRVNTVSDTARGAKVNWIMNDVQLTVWNHDTDRQINVWFKHWSVQKGAKLVKVKIEEIEQ